MNNQELHSFIETHLGEPLTQKDKAKLKRWGKASKTYDMQKVDKQKNISNNWNIIFRYGATAFASIILCLAVALPLTLGNIKTVFVPEYIYIDNNGDREDPTTPPTSDNKEYANGYPFPSSYEEIKENYLCFVDEEQIFLAEYWAEIDDSELIDLSYTAKGIAFINGQDTFEIEYRIRLEPNYLFMNYYDDYFATLVDIHNKSESLVSGNIVFALENVDVIRKNETIEKINVKSFIVDDIIVTCHISYDQQFSYIYFAYEGNDYFIKLEVLDCSSQPFDATYIKDVFMTELLENI